MKFFKNQEEEEQFLTWIDWLEADVLPQSTLSLESLDGFCCLGVACSLFIKKPKLTNRFLLSGGLPTAQLKAPKWLKDINDKFIEVMDVSLSELNDMDRYTFPEIAQELKIFYKKLQENE